MGNSKFILPAGLAILAPFASLGRRRRRPFKEFEDFTEEEREFLIVAFDGNPAQAAQERGLRARHFRKLLRLVNQQPENANGRQIDVAGTACSRASA